MNTPWGREDTIQHLTDGLIAVSTPSHGGIYVPPEQRHRIPLHTAEATFCGQGLEGWYEEDEDARIVFDHFPGALEAWRTT